MRATTSVGTRVATRPETEVSLSESVGAGSALLKRPSMMGENGARARSRCKNGDVAEAQLVVELLIISSVMPGWRCVVC